MQKEDESYILGASSFGAAVSVSVFLSLCNSFVSAWVRLGASLDLLSVACSQVQLVVDLSPIYGRLLLICSFSNLGYRQCCSAERHKALLSGRLPQVSSPRSACTACA